MPCGVTLRRSFMVKMNWGMRVARLLVLGPVRGSADRGGPKHSDTGAGGGLDCREACRVAITGASGLIGSALVPFLRPAATRSCASCAGRHGAGRGPLGPRVGRDRRGRARGRRCRRPPRRREHRRRALDRGAKGAPAVEPGRADALLAEALAGSKRKPQVLVSASALGYYGDRGDTWLTEKDAPADDFLGRLSVEWERADGAGAGGRDPRGAPADRHRAEPRGRRAREDAAALQGRARRRRRARARST